jgi:D-sedoheptulose 7-phosphate isomerase
MFARDFLEETARIASTIDPAAIERVASVLGQVRTRGGRLFIIGNGGGAAHASHAVCDFRKLGGFEAYAPTDNVAELTARINDDGWDGAIASWLRASRLNNKDGLLVFSVGGGSREPSISPNLVAAVELAKSIGAAVLGVVGRDGGFTAHVADACVIVPTVNPTLVTPHTEAFQAVVWHLLVSHPAIQMSTAKWESTAP